MPASELTRVNITALRDGILFADLIFSNGREVTARASDAVALALRTGASIFIREEILDEAGVAIPEELGDEREDPSTGEREDPGPEPTAQG